MARKKNLTLADALNMVQSEMDVAENDVVKHAEQNKLVKDPAESYANVKTVTWNGEVAHVTSASSLLDLYYTAGAARATSREVLSGMLNAALACDPLNTMRIIFYCRDIRGGLGERETFKYLLSQVANINPDWVVANMDLIGGMYGRFDDLYALIGTLAENDMWKYMRTVYDADLENMRNGKPISLWAKWVANPNSAAERTKKLGRLTAKKLGFGREGYTKYCKTLAEMRKYLNIPEIAIAAKDYAKIDYNTVPGKALMKYRAAFSRNDADRYNQYLEDVKSSKAKMNTTTITPADILHSVVRMHTEDKTLEEAWKNLPDYLTDKDANVVVMCDTSGSMEWNYGNTKSPMEVALSLAMYFGEHNNGPFANQFMTFSTNPSFVRIQGDTLLEKYNRMKKADWAGSTNIEAAMKMILSAAKKVKLPPSKMPRALVIVSDMQFNPFWACKKQENVTGKFRQMFEESGYELPNIIYWNVNAAHPVFHAQKNEQGVQLVSGESASVFSQLMKCLDKTPYEAMMEVLNSERYAAVRLEK